MKTISKIIPAVLSFLILFTSFFGGIGEKKASAQATGSVSLGANITAWLFDSSTGYINAVTDQNQLVVVRASDMQIINTISLGPNQTLI